MAAKCSRAQVLCRLRAGGVASGARILPLLLLLSAVIVLLLVGGGRRKQPVDQPPVVGRANARAAAAKKETNAERPVGCWRLVDNAGKRGDDGDYNVQCSSVAADGTLIAPAAVLATAAAAKAALWSSNDAGAVPSPSTARLPDADYTYVACFSGIKTPGGTVIIHVRSEQLTVASCAKACDERGHAYAVLVGSHKCRCADQPSTARMLPDLRCQLPCAGDQGILCGGRRGAAAVYHLRSADGSLEWTAWMTPWGDGGSSSGSAAVRIRRCLALRDISDADDGDVGSPERQCSAELQRRPGAGSLPQPPLLRHFIGCYAVASDPPSEAAVLPNETRVTEGCLRACEERGFEYAFVRLAGGCSCSRTLGVSRPVTFCDGVYGLPFYAVISPPKNDDDEEDDNQFRLNDGTDVGDDEGEDNEDESEEDRNADDDYASDSDGENKNADGEDISSRNDRTAQLTYADDDEDAYNENDDADEEEEDEDAENGGAEEETDDRGKIARRATVRLVFNRPPPDKRHVLLLAYHRSGSTYASELVSKHPGALYSFEPDVIYSGHRFALGEYDDVEQLHREFYRAFDRFLRCDVHRLPLIWMTLGSFFPRTFEHSPRMAAYIGCLRAHGSVACAPYFQAQCEAASIVSAKTIRLTATLQTTAFVRANPSLVVLHLMRDPRAVVSSRKLFVDVVDTDVRNLCDNMQRTMLYVNKSHPTAATAVNMAAGVKGQSGRHLFNVYYEDLVLNPMQSARDIYASMFRLNISDATVQRLRVVTGETRGDKLDFKLHPDFTTRKKKPELSLRKWMDQLTPSEVDMIEQRCSTVLGWYPWAKQLPRRINDESDTPATDGDTDEIKTPEKGRRRQRRA